MVEGDCVVIVPSGNCEAMAEYRLECGELVNRDEFWQGQIDEARELINDLSGATQELRTDVDELINATQELSDRLDQEILDRQSGDTEIWETMGPGFSGTTITDVLEQEISARTEADEVLYNMITAETQAREEADEELHQEILDEASARTAADEFLQEEIDAEISARTAADEFLQGEIDELSATTEYILETIGTGFTPDHTVTDVVGEGFTDEETGEIISITDVIREDEETTAAALNDLNDRVNEVQSAITEVRNEIQEVKDDIGNVDDMPEYDEVNRRFKNASDYANEPMVSQGGTLTVFRYINSGHDYGYWGTPNE
jgi:TolA-binding protein